jgi:excisionase family DNA binding protein
VLPRNARSIKNVKRFCDTPWFGFANGSVVHHGLDMPNQPTFIRSVEAAQLLGIDRSTLTRWVKAGKIAPIVRGEGVRGEMFFNRADVLALAKAAA